MDSQVDAQGARNRPASKACRANNFPAPGVGVPTSPRGQRLVPTRHDTPHTSLLRTRTSGWAPIAGPSFALGGPEKCRPCPYLKISDGWSQKTRQAACRVSEAGTAFSPNGRIAGAIIGETRVSGAGERPPRRPRPVPAQKERMARPEPAARLQAKIQDHRQYADRDHPQTSTGTGT